MKIIAGNLSSGITERELRSEFASYGEVSFVNLVWDRFGRDATGFGVIEMPGQAQAEAAISGLNGKHFKGRNLTVKAA